MTSFASFFIPDFDISSAIPFGLNSIDVSSGTKSGIAETQSDRMKLARAKKNDELEKNRLLMQEYLKQQEDEYKQQIEKKITVKANRKKKELVRE